MNKELAKICLELLARTSLKGNEVDAFNAVKQALIGIMNPPKEVKDGPIPSSKKK